MADTPNTDEGLFISLKVAMDALKESLDKAHATISEDIEKIEKEFSGIGEKSKPKTPPLEDLDKGLDKTKKSTDELGDKFQKVFGFDVNKVLGKVGLSLDDIIKTFTSPAGLITAVTLAGKQLLKLGMQFEEVYGDIAKRTGAVGTSLDGFKKSLLDIGNAGLETTFEKAGAGMAALNVAFDITGDELEQMTLLFADFADVTGQDMVQSINTVSPLMKKWGVDIADTEGILDKLTKAGQISGVSVGELTSSLMQGAAQFQAVGYGIDESLALLSSFEKQGVKTESVMSGMNKAIAYFSERNVDAAQGLAVVIEKIKSSTSETEALNVATNVFGMRSGVEFTAAIRSGKFALDDYIATIKNSEGTLERTDKASQTLGDRMAILGNMLKSKFAPISGMLVDISNSFLDKLIPALSSSGQMTSGLTAAHEDLKTKTDSLRDSVDKYKKANDELNDKTKILNATEKETITNRRDLYAIDIKKNLEKTIEAFKTLDREQENANKGIENRKKRIEDLGKAIPKQMEEIFKLEKKLASGAIFNNAGVPIAPLITDARLELAKLETNLKTTTTELYNYQSALLESNNAEQDNLNLLAKLVNAGQLQINEIAIYDKSIAKKIETLAAETKANEQKAATEKKSNETKTESTTLTYEQIEAAKKLKDVEAERLKLNADNEKRLIDNKIALLEYSRNQEIEAAKKIGADLLTINQYYDKEIANVRLSIQKEYEDKLSNPVDKLKAEKAAALKEARDAGASTLLLEKYYDEQIAAEEKKAIDEQIKAQLDKNKLITDNDVLFYEQKLTMTREQSEKAIAAVDALGGDTKSTADFWNALILAAQIDLEKAKQLAAKQSADKIAAINKKNAYDTIDTYGEIANGIATVAKSIDASTGEVIGRLAEFGVNVAKIFASGGSDITAWIGAISQGVSMVVDWTDSINNWLDKYVNKLSDAERYSKYYFKKMKESFQDSIGDAFVDAFENGIEVDELKKIIGKKIMKVAIESALFAAGLEDKLKEIGNSVSAAIKDGFSESELDAINAQIEDIYATTDAILQPLADNINASFDLIEEEVVKKRIGSFADYVNETWKDASESFTENMSSTFISAFTDGFDLTELRKRIGQQLLQVAVESALFTIGFQDKMEELGALVAEAINSGFTQQSLDAISTMVDQIYTQAATVISPIASLIGGTFGTNETSNAATNEATAQTQPAQPEQQTGVINQTLIFNTPTATPIETKRAAEQGARSAMFESGLAV